MIMWLLLFVLIVIISFLLAYQSMKDFPERGQEGLEHGLYLIRNPRNLTSGVLEQIHRTSLRDHFVISLERLFKGSKSALVIYGPKQVLGEFTQLSLLELEEYTDAAGDKATSWEVGTKDQMALHISVPRPWDNKPLLDEPEQFWWQIVLKPQVKGLLGKGEGITALLTAARYRSLEASPEHKEILELKNKQKVFQAQIRAALLIENPDKRKREAERWANIGAPSLIKIPKPLTSKQIMDLYRQRALPIGSKLTLTTEEILLLFGVR